MRWKSGSWIMPIVAQLAEPVAFIISISSAAVTVEEQERYRLERQLRVDHFSEDQINHALSVYAQRLDMIRQGANVKQIAAMQNTAMEEPWFPYLGDTTAEDIRFFIGIYRFEPVPFLRKVRCPFLGIWGALDTYVPVERSIELTRQALQDAGNTCFELKLLPRTNHGMRLAETGSLNERTTEFAPELWEILTKWLCSRL
jgi:pimeloyl-ACP methyl ester carboxylesterase